MLEDLYKNNSYKVMKRKAEDRSAWRENKNQKPAVMQTTIEEELLLLLQTLSCSREQTIT